MGILNVTPDSFSDGGLYLEPEVAIHRGIQMALEGAAMIDIGGESTRPGSQLTPGAVQLERVIPVIEALHKEINIPISVDTSDPTVMAEAIMAGVSFVNDVRSLQSPGALACMRSCKVPICLMHTQGEPYTMQNSPCYDNVLSEVISYLRQRIQACLSAGIAKERLVVDPGFGFGKNTKHNLILLRQLGEFNKLEVPVLVGVSRKRMIADILNRTKGERLAGGLALALWASSQGVALIRTHDVKETVDVLKMYSAVTVPFVHIPN